MMTAASSDTFVDVCEEPSIKSPLTDVDVVSDSGKIAVIEDQVASSM